MKKKSFCLLLICIVLLTACGNSSVSELRLQGIDLLEKGKYQEAQECFEEALAAGKGKISKEQYDILKYRAEAEYMLGEYEAAENTLDILVELDGDKEEYQKLREQISAKMLVLKASDALNEGDTETARELLDQAKAAGLQNDRNYAFNEVVYLEKTAQWQEAYEAILEFTQNYQGDAEAERELEFLSTRIEALNNNPLLSAIQSGNTDIGNITETK